MSKGEYKKPELEVNGNIKDITFHHSHWTCSVAGVDNDDHKDKGRGRGHD